MDAKVTVDVSRIPMKLDAIAANGYLGSVASMELARLANPYVPMRTGALASSADTSEPWVVTYRMPYARRLFYGEGFDFSKELHPNARSRWDKGVNTDVLSMKLTIAARGL